jgi:hypothetical protein
MFITWLHVEHRTPRRARKQFAQHLGNSWSYIAGVHETPVDAQ